MQIKRTCAEHRKNTFPRLRDSSTGMDVGRGGLFAGLCIQDWAKEWSLGCVNSRPAARGSEEAGFTQPRVHFLAQTCTYITGAQCICIDKSRDQGLGHASRAQG